MNTKEKLELAHWVAGQAKKSGADDASASVSANREVEVMYRDAKLDKMTEAASNSLSLSIYANQKYSNHTTNDLRKETLEKFVAEAVAMTKYLSEDPYRTLPDPKYYEGMSEVDLNLLDPTYQEYTADRMKATAQEIEEIARTESDQVISCTSSVGSNYSEAAQVNSNGFEGTRVGSSFYIMAEATVRDGETGRPEDYDFGNVRHLKQLPSPESVAKQCVQRALKKCGQTKIDSGLYEMVVESRALARLLGAFTGPLSGSSLQQKSSCFEGKLGEKIASEKLTIIDNPFIPGALGSRTYDSEGMATKKRTIIDKGVLKSFFIDNYYARKLGVEPTGGSTTNLEYSLGEQSLDELVASMSKGILVSQFIGGNSNGTTGDFSFGIMGQYVENGKIVRPVNEMNISGNVLQILHQLVAIGNDPNKYSSNMRPSMKFADVQFSGV